MYAIDVDDTLLHYLLVFGGILISATAQKIADVLGWDIVKTITKPFRKKKVKK